VFCRWAFGPLRGRGLWIHSRSRLRSRASRFFHRPPRHRDRLWCCAFARQVCTLASNTSRARVDLPEPLTPVIRHQAFKRDMGGHALQVVHGGVVDG